MNIDRLQQLRKEKKKSQKDVADYLGITRQGYGNYEKAVTEPDHSTLVKLANYFDVSTDYLLGRSEIRNPEKDINEDRDSFTIKIPKGSGKTTVFLKELFENKDDIEKTIILVSSGVESEELKDKQLPYVSYEDSNDGFGKGRIKIFISESWLNSSEIALKLLDTQGQTWSEEEEDVAEAAVDAFRKAVNKKESKSS